MGKEEKTCFVIIPISDISGYESGHFRRVYEHLIKPASEKAGFKPVRADDVVSSNHIVIDILRKIIESDIVLCDLSGKNPNVLYELGLRQAFNKPAALIKDDKTDNIFDIQGFRFSTYNHQLRIDNVSEEVTKIASSLIETHENSGKEVNSIIQLLGIEPAKLEESVKLSREDSVLLEAINGINKRLGRFENQYKNSNQTIRLVNDHLPGDNAPLREFIQTFSLDLALGKQFYENAIPIGTLEDFDESRKTLIFSNEDGKGFTINMNSTRVNNIDQIPF